MNKNLYANRHMGMDMGMLEHIGHELTIVHEGIWVELQCKTCNSVVFYDDIMTLRDRKTKFLHAQDLMDKKRRIAIIDPFERTEADQIELSRLNRELDKYEFIPVDTYPELLETKPKDMKGTNEYAGLHEESD